MQLNLPAHTSRPFLHRLNVFYITSLWFLAFSGNLVVKIPDQHASVEREPTPLISNEAAPAGCDDDDNASWTQQVDPDSA